MMMIKPKDKKISCGEMIYVYRFEILILNLVRLEPSKSIS